MEKKVVSTRTCDWWCRICFHKGRVSYCKKSLYQAPWDVSQWCTKCIANIIENGLNPGETYLRTPHTWTRNFNHGKYNNGLRKKTSIIISALTWTFCTISSETGRARSTFVTGFISWRWKISTYYAFITRLTIHFAGVNLTVTEPSRVSSLAYASHVNKFAVRVDRVTIFWRHALASMFAGAHVNGGIPGRSRTLVVSGNKWQVQLRKQR